MGNMSYKFLKFKIFSMLSFLGHVFASGDQSWQVRSFNFFLLVLDIMEIWEKLTILEFEEKRDCQIFFTQNLVKKWDFQVSIFPKL